MRAIDPRSGDRRWEFKGPSTFTTGVLTPASDLPFSGVENPRSFSPGYLTAVVPSPFYAIDARTGQKLWERILPGPLQSGPMTYAVGDRQYVAVTTGNMLFVFALPQPQTEV